MFKIEIHAPDGRELKMSQGDFIYYKDAQGTDTYWEWEKIVPIEDKFEDLFNDADKLVDQAAERLPNIPMPGTR